MSTSTPRYASVLGLGFGDCGKGVFTDALTRRWQARLVVRFNGGAQAGHNVVAPGGANIAARHHTFSQFGSGSFVPGVRTLLVDPMIVHPTALLMEAEILSKIGVTDVLPRLSIDAQCRITTPFHQAAGRLRELLRGTAAHGTCGVGVGETVRHALEHPGQVIRYADLHPSNATQAQQLRDKVQAIRETLRAEFLPAIQNVSGVGPAQEFQLLQDEHVAAKWISCSSALARHCPPTSFETIRRQLSQPGCVLFEGAQGVLLDEWRGFHPHTTWSSINTEAVDAVAARFEISSPIEHYGVLRTYLTRHGAGPLPTHDASLDALLPEPHNSGQGWQGQFRRGHPDAVLMRYALDAAGTLAGLCLSHLDVFQRGRALQWCERYSIAPTGQTMERIPLSASQDLDYQCSLTQRLQNARPQYNPNPIVSATDFLNRIQTVTSLPISFCGYGPTFLDVRDGDSSEA